MKTFADLLTENRSLMFPLSMEQFQTLKNSAKNTHSIESFFNKNTDFPAAGSINSFIKLLDVYNGKMFDDWKYYLTLKLDKLELSGQDALIFDIAIDNDALDAKDNVMYRRWWKALKIEKPTVIFYVTSKEPPKQSEVDQQTSTRAKKPELTKSVGQLIKKKEELGNTADIDDAGEAIGEPEKGIDYLIKKKASKAAPLLPTEPKTIDDLIKKRQSR